MLSWGFVLFVPLWFLLVHGALTAAAPWTVAASERWPGGSLTAVAGALAVSEWARLGGAPTWLVGVVNEGLVFGFAALLGHRWHAGALDRWGRRGPLLLVTAGAAVLLAGSLSGWWPASLVATRGAERSNMFPPTGAIAAAAVLQLGVVGLLRPTLTRWCDRPRVWAMVVAVNVFAMTVFVWHMSALVVVIGALDHVLGVGPGDTANLTWWLARPFWLVCPALVLAPMVAIFARYERTRPGAVPVVRPPRR